jgi:hypothetical protein
MNMRRQRQLHQDAMHMLVFVELMHQRQQFFFRHRRGEEMLEGLDADILAGLSCAHRYADAGSSPTSTTAKRRHAPAPLQPFYFCLDLFLNFFCDGFCRR